MYLRPVEKEALIRDYGQSGSYGKGSAVIYAADLTEDYVDFNKGDVNDPSSLGG